MESFLELMDNLGLVSVAYREDPGPRNVAELVELLETAQQYFDLSEVAGTKRALLGEKAVIMMWEVLSRIALPLQSEIPDIALMEARIKEGGRPRYVIPHTEITIARVEEGARTGEYLFAPSSVKRIGEFYEKVKNLPYVREMVFKQPLQFDIISGGWLLMPPKKAEALPGWLKAERGGQATWKWLAVLVTFALVVVVVWLVHWLAGRSSPKRLWAVYLRRTVVPATFLLFVPLLDYLIRYQIVVTGKAIELIQVIVPALTYLSIAWLLWQVTLFIAEAVIARPGISDKGVNAHILRLLARVVGMVGVISLFFWGGDRLGLPMYGLIAGLGVGGLAIALAAQRTFANFIGSVILFINKPVRVGDFCRYGDQIGTVESIGLVSTRIRSLERTIITVPNAEFSEMKLDNFAMRDQRLLKTVLQLRYETTPEQMRYILVKLREMLLGHPKVNPVPARVRFVGYGAYSKDVEIFAYLDCQDQDTFLAMQEDVLLRIEDIVNAAGSGFAFPSQTAYLSRDTGLDAGRGGEAEDRVKQWRSSGKLPFPEFEEKEREQLTDTLDYPPKGSPHHKPPEAASDEEIKTSPTTFSLNDLADLPSFAAKVQETGLLSMYLLGRLSDETRKLLSNYRGGADKQLKEALAQDLNTIVLGPSIYDERRFQDIERSPETRDLLATNPEGEDLARLNRLLLLDAYPQELSRPPIL